MELIGQHVVRVIAKALIAQREVGRVVESLLAIAAELLYPDIPDFALLERLLQRFAIEVLQTARYRKSANIYERLDVVRPERGQ